AGTYGLIKASIESDAECIVFCGVNFMVEASAIMNPDKEILAPAKRMPCALAKQLTVKELEKAKEKKPEAETLIYMNSDTKTKALADCICTAGNALQIVERMDHNSPILFGPDHGLSHYVRERTTKEIISIPDQATCPVHDKINLNAVMKAKETYPDVKMVTHPECHPGIQKVADYIGSTGGMIQYCNDSEDDMFLVAAEAGLSDALRREMPQKTFHPISKKAICGAMKIPTVSKVLDALENQKHIVTVPPEIAMNAKEAIDRMFTLS
ncbi:MAG: quinolinate synthase NadA, partial [Thermoplasmatales archaeon]|nr:quinolinate synthase NadA [Thermoplasmatales archaeon]